MTTWRFCCSLHKYSYSCILDEGDVVMTSRHLDALDRRPGHMFAIYTIPTITFGPVQPVGDFQVPHSHVDGSGEV